MPRSLVVSVAASLALAPLVLYVPAAHAADGVRTVQVRSFDGVRLVTNFFPAAGPAKGGRAPTVMLGHGFGGRGETDPDAGQVGPLRRAGYNVVTWNARGFGSGGRANLNYHRFEGRDSTALIDWIARQPEVLTDRPGDPRLGMAGGSYGGGIQLLTAGLDRRVDVIAPNVTWNSLTDSLYPSRVFKSGWASLLCLAGHTQGNRVAPQVSQGCVSGLASGTVPASTERWIDDHDLDPQVKRIRIPTLLLQGTIDTLFPLREAITNHRLLKAGGAPLKMVWYCGGHGECSTGTGPKDYIAGLTLTWFDRHLKGDRSVSTGPAFEYIDQTGTFRGGSYPLPALPSVKTTAPRARLLAVNDLAKSGTQTSATKATNGLTIRLRTFDGHSVGEPRLSFTYTGRASRTKTHVYAQLVDQTTGKVLGNQATPIPVTLDGRTRTVTHNLETIAWKLTRDSRIALQIIPNTALFDGQRALGTMTISKTSLTLPRVRPGTITAR
ncbi:X-Pro dipeptidyl-peptidase (S15 family) [Thermomonospora echinospora]|uniref:X-Pro dipeptidyl-peptidase (S15 family) n=1 Tax=Thermomonospora echinospora TaxID=1992 RepID=A0A1H5YJG3_9ACTN|nr:CocE/NonD family hydrolase [Thermomonospora echinospora]SEG23516.1 X-Pro dipeptidyl-peptidase (S15 family) [Thermomonospora echinospora]